eukprot:761909-Hanusia_phi.AAC.4
MQVEEEEGLMRRDVVQDRLPPRALSGEDEADTQFSEVEQVGEEMVVKRLCWLQPFVLVRPVLCEQSQRQVQQEQSTTSWSGNKHPDSCRIEEKAGGRDRRQLQVQPPESQRPLDQLVAGDPRSAENLPVERLVRRLLDMPTCQEDRRARQGEGSPGRAGTLQGG